MIESLINPLSSICQPVKSFLMQSDSSVSGVVLEDGTEIKADIVLSNATPKITFLDLLPKVNIFVKLFKTRHMFSRSYNSTILYGAWRLFSSALFSDFKYHAIILSLS